ncbi:MAG TPA: excinuclease ABC subunit UvrB [Candidatus Mediterraneibacter faecigallinarum]|uniref:UvrABC system protein B n=1 Tax=Candidatus Mediterraneibacter faecigallinarum TaxID=2838669 RepID=A0A9D2NVT9_9FIRM|nr:excinuclease ABC subunit UvrB [Candidatus Mediterraneibacter faecigallinarum]
MMDHFELVSEYAPTGDQPQAIADLVKGFKEGNQCETLLGVTGSGKTFTMANVIQQLNKPTLIIAHNKTLAAQLYGEFKEFFPNNAVEYFVSYYDYYQPEAYVPSSDTYIAKDSAINDEIDKLRLSATMALTERRDVIIVASVSCIYGLGNPVDYQNMVISLRPGMNKDRDEVIHKLIEIQYDRNDMDFHRGTFRVRGDVIEIIPAYESDTAVRIEFFGDEVDRITEIDILTGEIKDELKHVAIFPASHYVVDKENIGRAIRDIEEELDERVKEFKRQDKLLEAQRIAERTNFDIEMLKETGFCSGIENYSRHLAGLAPGQPPYTLIDYFPDDFIMMIDESHKTIPQIGGMYHGDQSRKSTLVDYGFRLPSAKDNRPLNFEEFESKINQVLFVSATPGPYEEEHELLRAEQVIRPTGLLDPEVEVRPVEGQIDDLIGEVNREVAKKNKVLVTTLTKRMAEDLTDYMREVGIRVKYLHSDVDTLERTEIIRDMRLDAFDVLVGINLLREGLDIPEITLVAILDADKEGFLRSETSLIQTIGRAARNAEGHVIMYADDITESMQKAIDETKRRREIQMKYNEEHGITPKTIQKSVRDLISISKKVAAEELRMEKDPESMSRKELEKLTADLTKQMKKAAAELNFEAAAELRDKLIDLKKMLNDMD